MNKYTITDPDNNIKSLVYCEPDRISFRLQEGYTAHQDHYPSDRFTYNGTEFVENSSEAVPFSAKSADYQVNQALKQMGSAGHYLPLHIKNLNTRSSAYDLINLAVSEYLDVFVSKGKYMVEEYRMVEQEVQAWRKAYSLHQADNTNPVPVMTELLLSDYENSNDTSHLQTIQRIEAATQGMYSAIAYTRRIRFEANKALKEATSGFEEIVQPYLNTLRECSGIKS